MDRMSQAIDTSVSNETDDKESAFVLGTGEGHLLHENTLQPSIPDALFKLHELDVLYEDDTETLWTYMRPEKRPSFTPSLLGDFEEWQGLITKGFGPGKASLRFLVLGSRAPGVFCFGGDLELFQQLIRDGDRDGLVEYGHRCCAILHKNMQALDLPIVTVGLVEGAALGGGFEALLSFDFIIAERGATFGLPEVMFGLFPGMGAHAILSRKLGSAMTERLIFSNETYTAEQMYDLGLIHRLAEPGEGLSACRDFITKSARKHSGLVHAKKAMRVAQPLEREELFRITELWADAALQLREQDLKVMSRLAAAQTRLAEAA